MDGGESSQLLSIYPGQVPENVVASFGDAFNITAEAQQSLI